MTYSDKVKQSKKYRISQEFIPDEQVQYYFKAADFVFLPRVDTLSPSAPPADPAGADSRSPSAGPAVPRWR